jgi:hypothetical protein
VPDFNHCISAIGDVIEDPHAIGSSHPNWKLEDVQPQSCGYEQVYGLDQFHGTPTMVVLLRAGCGFCQAQAEKLQEMKFELAEDDKEVHFVILDEMPFPPGSTLPIHKLTERCDFPIFQDTAEVDAWGLHDGRKDDFFFYDSDGVLRNFISDPRLINMQTTEGYDFVKGAVLELIAVDGTEVQIPEDMPEEGEEESGEEGGEEPESENMD